MFCFLHVPVCPFHLWRATWLVNGKSKNCNRSCHTHPCPGLPQFSVGDILIASLRSASWLNLWDLKRIKSAMCSMFRNAVAKYQGSLWSLGCMSFWLHSWPKAAAHSSRGILPCSIKPEKRSKCELSFLFNAYDFCSVIKLGVQHQPWQLRTSGQTLVGP